MIKTLEVVLRKHFDSASTKIDRSEIDLENALGFDLTHEQICGLCGAPSGSEIKVTLSESYTDESKKNNINKDEDVPGGVLFTVKNPYYIGNENKVIMYYVSKINAQGQESGSFGLYIKLTDFETGGIFKTFKGFGAYMTAAIAFAAKGIDGLTEIRLQAAGGRSWNDRDSTGARWFGYISWPKYGFDMDLQSPTLEMLPHFAHAPKLLGSCKKVSDVLALAGGYEFWKVVGDGWDMIFDLEGTKSFEILNKFLEAEGLK